MFPFCRRLAQELRTHWNRRRQGYLFETNRNDRYSVRTMQSVVKSEAQAEASRSAYILISCGIRSRRSCTGFRRSAYRSGPEIPRTSAKLATTQIYAETSIRGGLGESYLRAMGGGKS